jgi:hypothetical protein
MDPSSLLEARTASLSDILANGKTYEVPRFQRDYSWSDEEWEDLWYDIVNVDDEAGGGHYLGYVVLQTTDGKRFQVIDGQQRLATLSIVALAVLKNLTDLADRNIDPAENRQRFELLRTRFIGHVVASSLTTVSKLTLNRNDNDFFQSYLVQLRSPPARLARAKPSERALWRAYEYFYERVRTHFSGEPSGDRLASFLEGVGDRLVFTVIHVSNELRAYKVFETLNARGVKLSATDLLKNYLFSIVHAKSPADLVEAERRWQRVTDELGAEDFPAFARHLWNAMAPLARKQALFKAIKSQIKTCDQAFDFLERLERAAPVYIALGRPEDPFWSRDERRWLATLRLFNITHFYPLALAAIEVGVDRNELAKMFRVCATIAFRYNVASGLNPSPLEGKYNEVALGIRSGGIRQASQVYRALRDYYVDDERFRANFAGKAIRDNNRTKRQVRHILAWLESELSKKNVEEESDQATIEHILPENPGPEWDAAFPTDEQDRASNRLANYTLLEKSLNREAQNEPWSVKRSIYEKSSFLLTRNETAFSEWTPASLERRAERLASLAAHVWRLDYT